MQKRKLITALTLTACAAAGADGAVIALTPDDTQSGFTSTTTPALMTSDPAGTNNDNLWGHSAINGLAVFGTGEAANLAGQVWVAHVGEDAPTLTTTISGLDSGQAYNIYVYHVTHDNTNNNQWGINAGLGSVANYTVGDGVELENDGGDLQLERVLLGTVSGVTSAAVTIDDQTGGADGRTVYKGVGVELVPEPGSLALLALGGLMIARRRRD